MPTFAKLAAALVLAAGAWWASRAILAAPALPVATSYFVVGNLALGLVLGWTVIGAGAGRGLAAGLAQGLSGGVALAAASVLAWAIWGMLRRAMRVQYDGPVEALIDMARIAVDLSPFYLFPGALLGMIGGGVVAGIAAEFLAERPVE